MTCPAGRGHMPNVAVTPFAQCSQSAPAQPLPFPLSDRSCPYNSCLLRLRHDPLPFPTRGLHIPPQVLAPTQLSSPPRGGRKPEQTTQHVTIVAHRVVSLLQHYTTAYARRTLTVTVRAPSHAFKPTSPCCPCSRPMTYTCPLPSQATSILMRPLIVLLQLHSPSCGLRPGTRYLAFLLRLRLPTSRRADPLGRRHVAAALKLIN